MAGSCSTGDGSEVAFDREGDRLNGYLAEATTDSRPRPGLVLIPDVHGLSDHYRDLSRRFAAEGFTTLAIDLYSREGAPSLQNLDQINTWLAALPDQRVLDDLAAAAHHLARSTSVDEEHIGITGFCMGGQYALMAACVHSNLRAAVSWYGMLRYDSRSEIKPKSPLDLAPSLTCPYLGLFGADDAIIPIRDVEELRTTLRQSNQPVEIEIYQEAGHAFFNDTRPQMYRPEVARIAWPRAINFLRVHLTAAGKQDAGGTS